MQSLVKLVRLTQHYQIKKASLIQKISLCNQKITDCNQRIGQLRSDHELLLLLLNKKQLKGCITFIALYEFQRRKAIIKRRMTDIYAQLQNEVVEKNVLEQEQLQLKKTFTFCQSRFNRYRNLEQAYHVKKSDRDSLREECCIEELIYGQAWQRSAT